jgi:hypothetical protein
MSLITSMKQEAIARTHMGTQEAVVYHPLANGAIVVEVFADAIDVIFVLKIGDEVSWTNDMSEFVFELEWELGYIQ